jgi:hypothetical protein
MSSQDNIPPEKEVPVEEHLMMSQKERERLVVMVKIKKQDLTIQAGSEILELGYRLTAIRDISNELK